MSKSKNTAKESLNNESKTDSLTKLQFSAISEHSSVKGMPKAIREWLMSSRGDSPASRLAPQANSLRNEMIETCGLTLLQSFASYDPDSASWKTSQGCLVSGTREEFSETWPKQGIMQGGVCWELTMLAPRTKGRGCGLWPTPNVCGNYNRKGASKTSSDGLATKVKNWPTPKGTPSGPDFARMNRDKSGGDDLATKVAKWPTPTKQDCENDGAPSQYKRNSIPLNALVKTFPTPQASMMIDADMEQARYAGNNEKRPEYKDAGKGSLNPDWVEWLMGWPIGWSALEPIEKGSQCTAMAGEHKTGAKCEIGNPFLWLDWSVDPADREEPQEWRAPARQEPGVTPDRLRPIEGGELGGMNRHFDKETGRMAQIGLTQQVKLRIWPTPNQFDATCGDLKGKEYTGENRHAMKLIQAIKKHNCAGSIPRVAIGIKDRVNRLKAIGNGQVPQCAALAWRILTA